MTWLKAVLNGRFEVFRNILVSVCVLLIIGYLSWTSYSGVLARETNNCLAEVKDRNKQADARWVEYAAWRSDQEQRFKTIDRNIKLILWYAQKESGPPPQELIEALEDN